MTEPSQYFKGRTVQEQMNEVIGYVDVRSAEVATNAIAADVAQVHQDMLDVDADASAAAASAAAAAGTLANAVKKTGEASQSIAGDISVSGVLTGGTISAGAGGLGVGGHSALQDVTVSGNISVPTPTANTYAANKKYVDDKDALDVHLAGSEAITGAKTVPLEATGTFSNQIASSNKVKNELDNYAPMVRTTGTQRLTMKEFSCPNYGAGLRITNANIDSTDHTGTFVGGFGFTDNNGIALATLRLVYVDDHVTLQVEIKNDDGTYKYVPLAEGNA